METRGYWGDLIGGVGVEIAEVFDQGQEEYQPGIGEVLMVQSVGGAQETYTGKTGAGELKKTEEGDEVGKTQRYRSYKTTVAWLKYSNAIEVTREQIEDRDFAAALDEMKDLSISANFSQDRAGMQLFNGGFATTVGVNGYDMTWYGDGKPLFSTVHPTQVPGASTQSNASSTGAPFDADSLEDAHVNLVEQQTDDGIPMALLGKPRLVLPPALQKEGLEITQSELDPESAENAINVFKNGMGTDMAVSTFLGAANGGSNTAWFLVVPGRAKLMHLVRQAPRLDQDRNINNQVLTFTVDARWANAVKDWRRSYGSKGDSATYSS